MRLALPPSIGIVYKSPSKSNTICLPSGETSSDIQVALVAVNSALRDATNGKGAGAPRPPGGVGACADKPEAIADAKSADQTTLVLVLSPSPSPEPSSSCSLDLP